MTSLHQSCFQMAQGDTGVIRMGLRSLKRGLRAGLDPNALKDGLTPLSIMLQRVPEERAQQLRVRLSDRAFEGVGTTRHNARFDAVGALLDAGADPWQGQPNTWALPDLDFAIYLLMIAATREARGQAVRGPQGQTPLHTLWPTHASALQVYRLWEGHNPIAHPDWREAQDDQGRTVLHVAWRHLHTIGDDRVDEVFGHVLGLTQELLNSYRNAGKADMAQAAVQTFAAEDCEGTRVADLILTEPRIAQLMRKHQLGDEGEKLLAFVDKIALEGRTALPERGIARPKSRL